MTAPASFLLANAPIGWPDIRWAYGNGLITWLMAVDFADVRLDNSLWRDAVELELQLDLLMMTERDSHRVGTLLEALAGSNRVEEEANRRKWLFLKLLWLYENRGGDSESLEAVAGVWSDFGPPREIESFIYFLPAEADRDPSLYTREENLQHIVGKWKDWLDATRLALATS